MSTAPDDCKVIQGPWPSNLRGRALDPYERAGRYLPRETCCLVIVSPHDEDYGYVPRRRRLRPEDRFVLQLNLPFPDMPTLGQIARDRTLWPREPRNPLSPNLPPAIHRHYNGCVEAEFFRIDPERLLQDPDWYEKLDDP